MVSSVPGLHPLEHLYLPHQVLATKSVSSLCQVFLAGVGGKIAGLEDHRQSCGVRRQGQDLIVCGFSPPRPLPQTTTACFQTTLLVCLMGKLINYLESSISLFASEKGSASLIEPGFET